MDAIRFDQITRYLTESQPRRTVLGLVLAGASGRRDFGRGAAKKTCGKCKKRKGGKCKPKPNGTGCGSGKVCDDGKCHCRKTCQAQRDCCSGHDCLVNDSCAKSCTANQECREGCGCAFMSVEGTRHCIKTSLSCQQIPQSCVDTSDCDQGEECLFVQCPNFTGRCVPLCGS
jgi:hypothetical protein